MGKNPIQARDTARNAIKRCLDVSKKSDDSTDEALVRTYIKVLEDHWSRYLEAQASVDDSCGTDENTKALQETERIQAETWYINSLCNFNRLLLSIGKNIETKDKTTELSSARADSSAKLERISIPKFNGNPTEWISFHNLFSSLVEKTMLSGSQKMHYLKGSLQGEAFQLVKSFQITDDNYKEAWDLLRKRYNIERVIVEAHLSKISSFPAASSGCATSIKALIDNTQEHARALKALGRPTNQWDDWLVHLVVHKLDSETHKQWELALSQPEVPKFDTLIEFLETRCRSLAAVETHTQELHRKVSVIKSATLNSKLRSTTSAFHTTVSPERSFHKNQGKQQQSSSQLRKLSCYLCNGNHLISACQRFISLSISQRRAEIRKRNLCLNCLQPTHMTETCPSIHNCRVCQQRHNTLVHQDKESFSSSTSSRETTAFVTNVPKFYPKVLLYTAKVRLLDNCGNHQSARALLDTGSQSTFISEQCVQRLGIPRSHASIHVHGLSALDAGTTKGIVSIQLSSSNGTYEIYMNELILPNITNNLPNFSLNKTSWEHIHELQLADPEYDNTAPIDLLIGANYIGELLLEGLIKGPPGTPIAQNTQLGWVLSGKLHNFNSIDQHDVVNLHADASLENALTKFWHQEEVSLKSTMTEEEAFCESYYARTYQRQADGRYVVRMPLKEEFDLGNSRQAAVQALIRMEKRFRKHPEMHSEYVNFMREYEDLGHMIQDYSPTLRGYSFYLPNHGVIKADSTTTPLRVVFNASMKTTSGNSLNDIQLNGPVLQQPLQTILLRFRSHKFVMTPDVTKMFCQVLISKEQINLQRIVWRNTPEEEIHDYCLLTVTYGTNSGTYLAVKTLQQLSIDEGQDFKLAANVVLKDFYVDDLLTGTHDADQLIEAYSQLTALLERGRFQLRKWSSNHKPLLDIIPYNHRSIANIMRMDQGESIKTLGTYWHPATDLFSFSIDLDNTDPFTKRRLLSKATKIFDPLGLLSPVTISCKILFQRLWRPKVDWDEPLPIDVQKDWDSCYSSLPVLNILRIERWVGIGQPSTKTELHGFADASQQAYAAVIYCRTSYSDGSIKVHLVTAKTRVAPLQTVTLPRLELCAASLLAQLMQQVIEAIDSTYNFYGWTDSTVTLAWIQQAPSKWTTYVCNRVANIQRIMPSDCWHHVRSEHNPADCASRGVGPKHIINHPLWWTGPPWLQQEKSTWPKSVEDTVETTLDQRQKSTNTLTNCAIRPQLWEIIDKYTTLQRLLRITAYLLRPLAILQAKQAHRAMPRFPQWVLVQELHNAITTWIKLSQSISFSEDLKDCSLGKQLSTRSRLLKLRPFIDEKGLLRVGGRLQNAEASTDTKHPIILHKGCKLSKLLAQDIHHRTVHGGPQMMMACLPLLLVMPHHLNMKVDD